MNAITNRTFAIGAVLVMCLTALTCVNITSDDSDAYSTVSIEAGETKWFSLAQLGLSTGDVDDMNNMDSYMYSTPWYVYIPDNTAGYSPYSSSNFSVTGLDYSGATITCPDNVKAGTYTLEWGFMDEAGAESITITCTNVNVSNNHDGSSASKPLRYIDWFCSVPQNLGSYDRTLYIESGSPVNLRFDGIQNASVNITQGSGVTFSMDGNRQVFSGNITSDCTISVTFGAYHWTYNLIVVYTSVTHTIVYDGNGGTGSVSDTVVTDQNIGNTNVTLAANGFSKAGYSFAGWKVGNTTYTPGQTVTVAGNGSVTAVAQWSQNILNATANGISAVSGMTYSNQIGASANNGATISYAVKSCTGGTASVNASGLVTYKAPTVNSTSSYSVIVTATATFGDGQTMTRDVSFTVTVDPVLSFTNAATSGTLSVKGA